MYITENLYTEAAFFPDEKALVVVNNTAQRQETAVIVKNERISLELEGSQPKESLSLFRNIHSMSQGQGVQMHGSMRSSGKMFSVNLVLMVSMDWELRTRGSALQSNWIAA